ncbi:MIP/aquaporin family protein [Naasia lichenicola]|uniref:Aquaporin family protein n=1 Tax=Naasia lichenicola TaxID=2565933 RepID=A0A4S4FKZ1_9MICO|nr:MIP/aquaporin family protein [Naasia lichenicola]THG31019.1 aquaporin family protein [Naasia lichenicola]
MNDHPAHLLRRLVAEFLGTGLLVTVVVGSGIAASTLSPDDVGLQLMENSIATGLGLAVLIVVFGPVSGAHFNPVVTLVDAVLSRVSSARARSSTLAGYVAAQVAGAITGALLSNAMFEVPMAISETDRLSGGRLLGEVVATAGLVLLIFALTRTGRGHLAPAAVGAYIGAAYWFTSSTSFANPAVTIGRIFSDTFAGISPASVAPFIGAQLLGAALGAALTALLFPATNHRRVADAPASIAHTSS